jgi:hypothetical protein
MKATGLFFLCGRPCLVRGKSPADGDVHDWAFPLVERTKRGVQKVTAYWRGTDAAIFVQIHHERLKAGQALTLELDNVRPLMGELVVRVASCALAPDRWPRTEVDPTAAPALQPRPAGCVTSTSP